MLEKALESPLDSKEIQPVHPKGDQSWIFTERTEAEVETPILCLATWCEELTHWKRPWCWERLKVGGEGDDRGWDGWMASLTWWTWVWVGPGAGDGQGSLACCSPWGCKELDTTERLNWTELNWSWQCDMTENGHLQPASPSGYSQPFRMGSTEWPKRDQRTDKGLRSCQLFLPFSSPSTEI